MTLKEFQDLARDFGASVVFETSASAVFDGPRFNVTLAMTPDQLAHTYPAELCHLLATAVFLN